MEFPSQYIDDCHVGQLLATPGRSVIVPRAQRAEAATYIVRYNLIEADYFTHVDKSQFVSSTVVFFGFSVRFYVPSVSNSPG